MRRNQRLRRIGRFLFLNALPRELFDDTVSLDTARELFARFVKLVEIENHNYCNRICWFCPNTHIERRSTVTAVRPELYQKILENLAEIEYRQTLVWARYHEPMGDDSLYANLALARRMLPKAFLTIHTNGDYLSRETVRLLEDTGLDQVRINLYIPNGQPYTEEGVDKMMAAIAKRTGLTFTTAGPEQGGLQLTGSGLHMPVNIPDFSRGMSSRGGDLVQVAGLETYQRTSVCLSPLQHVVVDFNGSGVLCCQVRSDVADHAPAIIGDLNNKDYTLFHLYRDMAKARHGLAAPGPKHGVCRTCNVNEGGPYRLGRLAPVARGFQLLPGTSTLVDAVWRWKDGGKPRYQPATRASESQASS